MFKKPIFWIIAVSVILILLLLFAGISQAQANLDESDLLNSIDDEIDPPTNKDCRQICRGICKKKPLLFGGRQKCQKKCKKACKAGEDVTTMYFP